MVCVKCNLNITNVKESIKCSKCGADLHVGCCRIRTAAKLAQMQPRAVAEWHCEDCQSESYSTASNSDSEDSKVIKLLKNMQLDMNRNNAETKASFVNLEGSLSQIRSSLEGVQNRITALETENEKLKTTCQDLGTDNLKLINQVSSLQREMDELQQYSRNLNIEIRGIPSTNNEDIYCILETVAKVIGVKYARGEISIAHRLQAPRGRNTPPAIVTQFVSRSTRSAWLQAAKKHHFTTKDLSPSLPTAPVFINEHLTHFNKMLLGRAKALVRGGRLVHAWIRDGKLFIRKSPDSPAVRAQSMEIIDSTAGIMNLGADNSAGNSSSA